jgi:arsenate reductase (glutaredoxin)
MTITVYGIANCDSVKKARALLDSRGVAYVFHDYKKQGVPEAGHPAWGGGGGGGGVILNRKGTTWRTLDEAVKTSVVDDESAITVMIANPSTIKRPVIVDSDDKVVVGVDLQTLSELVNR